MVLVRGCRTSSHNTAGFLGFMAQREATSTSAFFSGQPPTFVERLINGQSLPVCFVLQVWTCEVGECGASLCSVECDARNCATLNWAVREDPSGRFPMALPKICRHLSWQFSFLTALCYIADARTLDQLGPVSSGVEKKVDSLTFTVVLCCFATLSLRRK